MSCIAPYSPREELANALTHGVGFLVSVAAQVHMIDVVPLQLSVWQKTGVLAISINQPEAMNALHPEMLTGVGVLVDQASADDSVCAVVLQGEGRAFK